MAKKLMEVVHEVFRTEHYACRTEETYTKWICRSILYFDNRHPRDLGSDEIQRFLTFRAKRPKRVPVVLTRSEVGRVLEALNGVSWLMASLLYGSGLRLVECLRLSGVSLPDSIGRKYKSASNAWSWQ